MTALLLLVALAGCGDPAPLPSPTSAPTQPTSLIHLRADVHTLASAREHATVVDVRTRASFAEGHVPGAVVVPLASLDPRDGIAATWDRGLPVYVIDASGEHAAEAAQLLGAAGFEAYAVDGGMIAWAAAGLPVEAALR